jgi:hypothetical protein
MIKYSEMIQLSNIKYTRADLNGMYRDEQIKIRRNSINKITEHLSESIIKKATQGESSFTEYFPKNKFSDLKNEVLIKIKTIFPDSVITVIEIDVNGTNSTAVTIDWSFD